MVFSVCIIKEIHSPIRLCLSGLVLPTLSQHLFRLSTKLSRFQPQVSEPSNLHPTYSTAKIPWQRLLWNESSPYWRRNSPWTSHDWLRSIRLCPGPCTSISRGRESGCRNEVYLDAHRYLHRTLRVQIDDMWEIRYRQRERRDGHQRRTMYCHAGRRRDGLHAFLSKWREQTAKCNRWYGETRMVEMKTIHDPKFQNESFSKYMNG